MSESELVEVLVRMHALTATAGPSGCLCLLAEMPQTRGGLQPIASCILHPSEKVRGTAGAILQQFESHGETRGAVGGLNPFLLSAFEKMHRSRRNLLEEGC